MITVILFLTIFGLILALLVALSSNAIKCKLARYKYRKFVPNIPFDEKNVGLFGNHILSYALRDNCQRIHKTHQELGETFVILLQDTLTISTIDVDLLKEICIDNASIHINRYSMAVPIKEFETDCILTAKDDQWRRIRKSFAGALKPSNIKKPHVLHEIESSIGKLIQGIDMELDRVAKLNDSNEVEFNMNDVIHRFQLQVVLSCFYKQYDKISFDFSRPDAWTDLIENAMTEGPKNPFMALGLLLPIVRRLVDFFTLYLHSTGAWRRGVFKFIDIQTRLGLKARKQLEELQGKNQSNQINRENFILQDGTKFNRNIIDSIIDEFHSGKLRPQEYFNTSAFLLSAADKTVADVLVFILYQLAINPKIQAKLRESTRTYGIESEYLDWIIQESLRLSPPVVGGPARSLSRPVKLKNGSTLPVGSLIVSSLFSLHRHKKYWGEDADEFKPERWQKSDQFHPAQYMPYGSGLRTCVGKYFADFEIKLIICSLIKRYQFSCNKIKEDLYDFHAPMLVYQCHKSPHFITVKRLAKRNGC